MPGNAMPYNLQKMNEALLHDADRLTGQLVNQLLLLTFGIMTVGMVVIQLRSWELERAFRDWFQLASYAVLLGTMLGRHRLSFRLKLAVLIAFMLGNGVIGIMSLGFFGSAVYFFPLSCIYAAMFFGPAALVVFTAGCIAIMALAALAFISGYSHLADVQEMVVSPLVWGVYLVGFGFLVVVSGYAVYRYRSANEFLLRELRDQRDKLGRRTQELEVAMAEIDTLRGIIPICSYCHQIRNDAGAWDQLEVYISRHSLAKFSHGICPSCIGKME